MTGINHDPSRTALIAGGGRRIIDPNAPAPAYAGLLNLGGFVRGVQRIIRQAARINNKAATGVGRVWRDMMMPIMIPAFVKLVANGRHGRQLYGYHIDWDTPVTAH